MMSYMPRDSGVENPPARAETAAGREGADGQHPLEGLVRRHLGWLRGWLGARLRGRRRQDVDDLCQDVLLRALRGYDQLRNKERFPAWLYRIAVNRLRDYLRRQVRSGEVPLSVGVDVEDPRRPDSRAGIAEDLERTIEAVMELPRKYREPMLLRHVQDLSYSEIAGILGVSENAVQVRIHRARQMLRRSATAAGRGGLA